MRSPLPVGRILGLSLFASACSTGDSGPTAPGSTAEAAPAFTADATGPNKPNANLEVILRGDGFGLISFRQPKDDAAIIYLDTWIRDLAPNTEYLLQRAVDTIVDDECTSTAWLTLGRGTEPQSILTDQNGTAREPLFRDVSAVPAGSAFDIHFRVVEAQTQAMVLESACYQFQVRP